MKTIIAGSRGIIDLKSVYTLLDHCPWTITEVVSGGAAGVDSIAISWAAERQISVKSFVPEWEKWGKKAGPVRNRLMALYADALFAIWDGTSRGTSNMIGEALDMPLEHIYVKVIHERKI